MCWLVSFVFSIDLQFSNWLSFYYSYLASDVNITGPTYTTLLHLPSAYTNPIKILLVIQGSIQLSRSMENGNWKFVGVYHKVLEISVLPFSVFLSISQHIAVDSIRSIDTGLGKCSCSIWGNNLYLWLGNGRNPKILISVTTLWKHVYFYLYPSIKLQCDRRDLFYSFCILYQFSVWLELLKIVY